MYLTLKLETIFPTELVIKALWRRGDYIWVTVLIGTVNSNGNALKDRLGVPISANQEARWGCPQLHV